MRARLQSVFARRAGQFTASGRPPILARSGVIDDATERSIQPGHRGLAACRFPHRRGRLFYPRIFEDGAAFNDDQPGNDMEPVPDIDASPGDYDIFRAELEPGDTLVFDFRTLHGTGDAEVRSVRRAFSTRWLGDDATYCERPGETSPPYVDHGMQHGDPMRSDWFPLLWERKD